MLIVSLPGGATLANRLARETGAEVSHLEAHAFPDGEQLVRFDVDVAGRDIVLAGCLHPPDRTTLPMLFAADTGRELGARSVTLVTPYLPYMRQDARFRPGEAVTSRTYARVLSASLDRLITVDPHLHRWHSLADVYTTATQVVPAAPAVAEWLCTQVEHPLVIGPDEESHQWAAEVARLVGAPCTVLRKVRRGDKDVTVAIDDPAIARGHTPVLLDDILSTGRTVASAARALQALGLPAPMCVAVHAVCAGDALDAVRAAGVTRVVTCDTIEHPTNAISIVPALAEALRSLS